MRWLLAALIVAGAVAAVVYDPRVLVALVLGVAIYAVGTAMLRNMAAQGGSAPPPEPVADQNERTVFRCELCGAELLLVVRGERTAPRHCGERMQQRTEIVRG